MKKAINRSPYPEAPWLRLRKQNMCACLLFDFHIEDHVEIAQYDVMDHFLQFLNLSGMYYLITGLILVLNEDEIIAYWDPF